MEINTNITVSERESRIYKRLQNLSVNEEPLPQGDGNIRISPFDDYFMFTLFDEVDGEDKPIDLSNVGNLYISFIGDNDEIRIKNYTNVDEISMADGQVLFRISKDESKRILNLDNRNFYISSKMVAEENSESDESVIYTGTFSTITDDAQKSLTSQINDLRLEYAKSLASLEKQVTDLTNENNSLSQTIDDLNSTITALRNNNTELSNELADLADETQSVEIKDLQDRAKDIQAQAEFAKSEAVQIQANQNRVKPRNVNTPTSYASAAKANQKFSI